MAMQDPVAELEPRFSSAGATPTPWAEARGHLEGLDVYWLATVRPDGRRPRPSASARASRSARPAGASSVCSALWGVGAAILPEERGAAGSGDAAPRHAYPSDVSDEERAFVVPYLTLRWEDAPQRDPPLHEAFIGPRWLVRAGATRRLLPHDLPPWWAVYRQTRHWLDAGDFEEIVATVARPALCVV